MAIVPGTPGLKVFSVFAHRTNLAARISADGRLFFWLVLCFVLFFFTAPRNPDQQTFRTPNLETRHRPAPERIWHTQILPIGRPPWCPTMTHGFQVHAGGIYLEFIDGRGAYVS